MRERKIEGTVKVDLNKVEEAAKELYIRALKRLPPDIKQGFDALSRSETDAGAKRMLGTMIRNIAVAEDTDNLLCQDTGIPIYNVWIGRGVEVDGVAIKEAIRNGCARSTREYSLRSSIVHPITRVNEHTSCGRGVPVINIDFSERRDARDRDDPEGLGLGEQFVAAHGGAGRGRRRDQDLRVDCVLEAGGKTCPPTIVGVGVGGTADLCVHSARSRRRGRSARAATIPRARSSRGAHAGRQHARRRAAGPGRRFDRLRGARGNRGDAHHHEPGRGQHAVPFGAPRPRHVQRQRASNMVFRLFLLLMFPLIFLLRLPPPRGPPKWPG